MATHFTQHFFKRNRQRLQRMIKSEAPIVLAANGLLQRTADSTYHFQQDSNFWYLTGVAEPNLTLVIDESSSYIIVPQLSDYQSIFDGITSEAELLSISGVTDVVDQTEGWRRLQKTLKKHKQAALLLPPPAYVDIYGMYTNPARAGLYQKLHDICPELRDMDIRSQLAGLRVIKQPSELAAIEQAIAITADAIAHVSQRFQNKNYQYEYQIEADLNQSFRSTGASGHAFTPIISSGERACLLHNISNNGKLAAHDLLLMDVGAEVEHYAADISRTISAGQPSERQQAVHAAVVSVQQYALSLLKPGTDLKDYEQQIETYMGECLASLGLIKQQDHAAIRQFFPHATSHFLGLDVHDVGERQQVLTPGMVLTCEPGIYIAAEGIGVRIEDDVLITKDGNRVLSTALPNDLC